MQNFRLLTAHVKFHQIYTLIGSFCWKYVKVQLKIIDKLCLMTLKSDTKLEEKTDLIFQKWQEFAEFWSEHSKFLKFLLWLVSFVQSR